MAVESVLEAPPIPPPGYQGVAAVHIGKHYTIAEDSMRRLNVWYHSGDPDAPPEWCSTIGARPEPS